MKLTVLGCWAPYPRAGGACSGYLLQAGGKNILIDCGNGVISNLQKYLDFRLLDAIFISHLHSDHYLDLHCLRHAIGGARRRGAKLQPVPLYVPMAPEEAFQQINRFTEAFEIRPIEELSRQKLNGLEAFLADLEAVQVFLIKTAHPLPTYAVRVHAGKKFFYSADTKWCDYLVQAAAGANIALVEASVIEKDREHTVAGHLTAVQAGLLAAQAGVGELIITHFWPAYDQEILRSEAEAGFGRPVITAFEGMQYLNGG